MYIKYMESFGADLFRTFQILVGTFVILILGYNFNSNWRRFPWDVSVDKFGFHIYIPVITSLFIAVALTIILRVVKIGASSFFAY